MIGKIVSHYKIIEKLGGGGMGVVYKAEDTKLKRTVALKFLPAAFTFDDDAKKRFINEAQAASSLDHNNICNIHEIGETDDGQIFICMNCYEGETLKKKIERGQIKTDEAIDIIVQIATGLQKAHEKGIIHRDIKPANIFITNDGVVKVLDFGLAKLSGQTMMTKMGETVGTIAYMSPEQAKGEEVDKRSDIWSLGVVLYEAVSGQRPFKGEFDQAVVYSILNENPRPLTGLPMELERILNRSMAKSPDDRYQYIEELYADLKSLIKGLRNEGLKSEVTIRGYPSIKRAYLYAVFIVLILLLIISGFYFIQLNQQKSAKQIIPDVIQESITETQWQNSIAVLPFSNISANPEQEYFGDGMTEQIINNISQLPDLKVIARTSVMKFKKTEKTIPEIGEELKVAYILEGSVRKAGNRIRVTAQLIKTVDGFHLWAKDYDQDMKDIFTVQDDISRAIANSLQNILSGRAFFDIQTKKPDNMAAYEAFLKASYLGFRFDHVPTMENYQNAETMFKTAIKLDQNYAPSHAGLAYLYMNYNIYIAQTEEEKLKNLKLLERHVADAIRLDPTSPDVLFTKAWFHWNRGEIIESYETIKKALTINPNHVNSNLFMGYTLRNRGLIYHSFAYFNKVTKLDPLEPWSYTARGLSFWIMGIVDSAFMEYDKALQLEPNDSETLEFYVRNLLMMKMWKKAEQLLTRFINIRQTRDVEVYKVWLLAAKGKKDEALKEFENIGGNISYARMVLNALLGFTDKAIEYLEERNQKEVDDFSITRYIQLKNHPFYDSMRNDIRFQKILENEKEKYPFVVKYYGY